MLTRQMDKVERAASGRDDIHRVRQAPQQLPVMIRCADEARTLPRLEPELLCQRRSGISGRQLRVPLQTQRRSYSKTRTQFSTNVSFATPASSPTARTITKLCPSGATS